MLRKALAARRASYPGVSRANREPVVAAAAGLSGGKNKPFSRCRGVAFCAVAACFGNKNVALGSQIAQNARADPDSPEFRQ